MAFLHQIPRRCLGFDVAKETIAVSDGRTVQLIDNRRGAIRRFLKNCHADLALCEPTGGHETILLEECLRLCLRRTASIRASSRPSSARAAAS